MRIPTYSLPAIHNDKLGFHSTTMATTQNIFPLPAMPPAVPARHPGRLSRVKTPSSMKTNSLLKEYLDIWEHATLLYHGFEWQAAGETFLMLSRQIERKVESILCLLNAAIIFARQGDFATASQILNEAEPEGDLLPFTMFIMGHVEFEQGNFEQSEDAFNIALAHLKGSSQSYEHYGLEYTLRASHIQQNLRIFETKSSLFGVLGSIGALPADGVFEAPTRPHVRPLARPTVSRSSSDSDDVPSLSDVSSPASVTSSPVGIWNADASYERSWYSNHGEAHSIISDEFDFGFGDMPDYKTLSRPLPPTSDPSVIGSLVMSLSQNHAPNIAPPRRPTRQLVPRDARVQCDLTKPLAHYIRQLPSQKALEPRSATLEPTPNRDLVDFLKASESQDGRRRYSRRAASEKSSCGDSLRPDSITSEDLIAEEGLTRQAGALDISDSSKHAKYPYRSGVGSVLLRENSSTSVVDRPLRRMARRNDNIESTDMSIDSLHSLLCSGTSDRQSSTRSYVFTDEVGSNYSQSIYSQGSGPRSRTGSPSSRSVSMTAVHPALRPQIPSRNSSLLRRVNSSLTRQGDAKRRKPTNSVVVSTNYSTLKPGKAPVFKESLQEDPTYSGLFGKSGRKLR